MLFLLFGLFVGILSSLVGIGGGLLIVPVLLAVVPDLGHQKIVGISMAAVAFNSTSGFIGYSLRRLVHVKSGIILGIVSFPGAILGVYVNALVSQDRFALIFGCVVIVYSVYLLVRTRRMPPKEGFSHNADLPALFYMKGAAIAFLVGFVGSFLGVGGGMFYVPALSALGFLVQMAAGTSQLILTLSAWVATAQHVSYGNVSLTEPLLLQIGLGVVVGAQIGPAIARRVSGRVILNILAVGLLAVGIRLIVSHF